MEDKLAKQAAKLSPIDAHTVFYHQTIADCLGLNTTDHKCLLFLFEGRKTMGQLSTLTGLTLGAQTAAVERLERTSYVRRVHDQQDRRRVYVEIISTNVKKMAKLFTSLGKSIAKLEATYSPSELQLIHNYMQQTADILYDETFILRDTFWHKKRSIKSLRSTQTNQSKKPD
ncbi:MAG TPA: MarR family transcriptional regulator [Candidatus Saccharimonas sp.]|nr:MarR family transcriptional regulator [Candidatus Saccharimonas sp.]